MKKLPKSLTRVTGFSKTLALLLLIAFLGVAFYAGVMFDRTYVPLLTSITPTPTPISQEQVSCSADSDCVLASNDTQNSCCPNTKCLNLADTSTIAVSKQWHQTDVASVCGKDHMCPMIMAICAKEIAQENTHYSAKCVEHICTKVRN